LCRADTTSTGRQDSAQSVQTAINDGVNVAFFSGNEMFWKTRWASSIDGSDTPYRTIVSYKETHYNAPVDPDDPPTWTGTWRDPRFSPPADGDQPENAVTGQLGLVDYGTADITVPYQYSKLRLWRNTAVASLKAGQTQTLAPGAGTLGFEWDVDADNGFRPTGEFDLSSTTVSGVNAFYNDYGTTEAVNTTATHNLTQYRAPSGALVFGAGTVDWAWGLDSWNGNNTAPDPNMEQATVNLFADMGNVQPATLESGLVAATESTDHTPPTSTITSPSSGASYSDGSSVTVTGTATDSGGGVVAGVAVSTNGGTTWHPATLTTADGTTVSWSYTWIAHGYPSTTVESRAVDDSGNIETPSDPTKVNINCPCSIWGTNVTPTTIQPGQVDSGDGGSIELGVKFESSIAGTITGIRFYKAAANTGTHIGNLWSASGQLLATATFTNESASGWQQVNFASPVLIAANTTYVASYFAPNGHYSSSQGYFYGPPSPGVGGATLTAGPLQALPATSTQDNGEYSYSSSSIFPTNSTNATNYWVDPVLAPLAAPGQVTGVTATGGSLSALVSWTAPSTGGPVATYTVTPYIGTTAQTSLATTVSGATSTTVTGLTQGTSYSFVVQASNSTGSGPASAPSAAVLIGGPTAPSAPQGVTASPASSQALVSWSAPSSNGGSPITSYTVTPYAGSTKGTAVSVSSSATSADVTGLTNGTAYTFQVTATNSSGTSSAATSSATTPEDTILDFNGTPTQIDSGDTTAIEVGVKFESTVAGSVTGIRFYKASTNTGTHVGSVWSASGGLLASATFSNESASGWQTVTFSSPVTISPNTIYVAGYFAPAGHYTSSQAGFNNAVGNGPLEAVANGTSANGVYTYGSSSVFPSSSYNATNYWVDVLFQPTPTAIPGQVTGVTATAESLSALVSWTAPTTGGTPTSYTVTPYIGATAQTALATTVSGTTTSTTVTGLTQGTSYTFVVQATNTAGSGPASAASNSVQILGPTAPGAPQGVTASPASSQALVSWSAPVSGGTPTSYTVTPYAGSTAGTPVSVSAPSTSADVTGLTNSTAYTFQVTATNGSGTGAAATSSAVTPEDTILDFNGTPTQIDSGDTSAVEVGVKFESTVAGSVTGIRFYKASTNTGTHVGSLWSAAGALLASATFSNESASGWQTVTFSSPVAISANTIYVAGYFAPNGHYTSSQAAFTNAVVNGPLESVANATSANGVYTYGSSSVFPASSYNATNYWVDVLFAPSAGGSSTPGAPHGVTASPASSQALVSWSAPVSGGTPTSYTVTPYAGSTKGTAVSVTAPSTSTDITGLTTNTAYTFQVTATNGSGTGAAATSSAVTPEDTILDFNGTPTQIDSGDTSAVEVGVKFESTVAGSVTGIRFYKASTNTGTHVGSLWSAAGALLASATFSNESTSGWQTVTFSSPVAISANTIYVAGYFAPNGHYTSSQAAFTNAVVNGPLESVANATSANGVYTYGSSSVFPASSYNATNYWVDVLFAPSAGGSSTPGAPQGVTASPASSQALVSWSAPVSGGTPTSYTVTPYAGSTKGTAVSVTAPSTSTDITGLTTNTAYTFQVTATNGSGTGAAATSSAVTPEDTILDFNGTPTQIDSGDTSAVEVGVKFESTVAGSVTGIRFYKASTNTGTHVGSLWSAAGALLASATFSNESTSGWQTVTFSSPVAISANTIYVAGYFAPNGHYTASQNGFTNAVINGPLSAVATGTSPNGVYAYGTSSVFPGSSYNATNYWVDVLFNP
jgi:electron transfer flavoprotein alpha/beta subunit